MTFARTLSTALRLTLVMTVILGIVYPLVVGGIGALVFGRQASGSWITDTAGQVRGSALIGQTFVAADGKPLARYFQPRPSAAGDGYDATASGGSNLGPESPDLLVSITARQAQIAAFNGVPVKQIPADAVTASGSGLDPDISPEYAALQIPRIATARGLPVADVEALVARHTTGRDLGFIGEPRVNVVTLNAALDGY
ncbi:MAG: K(+)-transporting ATPase subunit C [Zoogloeaceae bacterium]|jgi:K+-transporting ATPase ATPase C chain|nr:K(+)-transporting ATPase subunit C [Zoogloeaceae bacterium]